MLSSMAMEKYDLVLVKNYKNVTSNNFEKEIKILFRRMLEVGGDAVVEFLLRYFDGEKMVDELREIECEYQMNKKLIIHPNMSIYI